MTRWLALPLLICFGTLNAEEPDRRLGMNIIGNNETPRTLIIVPWKSAQPGDLTLRPLNSLVEAGIGPLDPDVVRRELRLRAATQAREQRP
ncbi:MAG: hypothetical protein DWQ09_01135 [Proteobacteria bacterium]|nr:MAG: hypothetical protein DWQ09_01135 [Pseudomonadota bacterium]QKK12111.1 MAG: hypothetical protein HND59_11485 [Pseudomonadota bacterium]